MTLVCRLHHRSTYTVFFFSFHHKVIPHTRSARWETSAVETVTSTSLPLCCQSSLLMASRQLCGLTHTSAALTATMTSSHLRRAERAHLELKSMTSDFCRQSLKDSRLPFLLQLELHLLQNQGPCYLQARWVPSLISATSPTHPNKQLL